MKKRFYILTRTFLSPSARALSEYLNDSSSFWSVRFTSSPERIRDYAFFRWGNSESNFVHSPKMDFSLNSREVIYTCSNKLRLSRKLVEDGVPTVEFHKEEPKEFPVLVRTTLTGMGGVGAVVCEDAEQFSRFSGAWWSPWYNFSIELGVHVIDGVIHKVMKKLRDGETEEKFPIRNSHRGYRFSRVDPGKYPKLEPVVKSFYDSSGAKYGRLDVGWDSMNKIYRVIEFNTAPGVSENEDTLEMYGNRILNHIEEIK